MSEFYFNISKQQDVKEIQNWFSSLFPYLKINFYARGNTGSGAQGSNIILFAPEVRLKNINPNLMDHTLIIRESSTVSALEKFFCEKLGLAVQILRKSGNLWLDTARTNAWTLQEQNSHGQELSPQKSNKTG